MIKEPLFFVILICRYHILPL